MLCYKLTWRIWWKIFKKKDLRLILKSDLFIAVEFNKAGRMGEWFGCIMNNCGAKTKNLRQFPVRARCWVSLLSGVTFYIGRVMLSSGGVSVSVLCFSSSLKYSHCGWLLFSSRLFFSRTSLVDVTQGLSVNGRLVSPPSLVVAVSFWLYPADEQTVCNYWKLFLLTDNTSFCGKKQLGGHITSASGQASPGATQNVIWMGHLLKTKLKVERLLHISHNVGADWRGGGPARLKSNDSRNDICERLQRILELLCFFPM